MIQINAEQLRCQLQRQKITTARFDIPIEEQELANSLEVAYIVEVEKRYRVYSSDEKIKKLFADVARAIKDKGKFGILFCGQCGNGKTTMMYAMRDLFNLLSLHNLIDGEYSKVQMVVWDSTKIARVAKDEDIIKIANIPLLAIDDLGKEPKEVISFGNVITPMIDVIEHRYKLQLPTFVSTNLLPKQIGEKYGTRIADRFNEMFHKIVFDNQSYRK